MRLIFPVKGIGISQPYKTTHKGVDFGWNNKFGGKTAPIYSVGDGKVYKVGVEKYSGSYIVIKHNGYYSKYAHLSKTSVKKGQLVKCLEQIGNMGHTGIDRKTGESVNPHLHLSLYKGSFNTLSHVNPLDYLFVDNSQTILSNTAKKYSLLKYGETRTCIASTLRIRKAPSLTAKQVSTIKKGDKIKIYEYENGFYKLSAENNLWAYAKYLK